MKLLFMFVTNFLKKKIPNEHLHSLDSYKCIKKSCKN